MLLCGCVGEDDLSKAREVLKSAGPVDIIEVRIDRFKDHNDAISLIKESSLPVIATFRRANDGGRDINEDERLSILIEAISAGASYVDLEVDLGDHAFSRVADHAKNCKIICSFHDFSGTPGNAELEKISKSVLKRGHFGKIVTKADKMDDCHRVLELILRNKGMTAFCMGSRYRFTRVMSMIYGAPVGYCKIGNPRGKGQYSADEMRKLLKELV